MLFQIHFQTEVHLDSHKSVFNHLKYLVGLSERAAELGGSVTAGRDDDSFRLALTLPPREVVALGREAS